MPFIMGLEGPRPSPFQAAGAELLGLVPKPLARPMLGAARTECCWQCSCETNPCCDSASPTSRAVAAVRRMTARAPQRALHGLFTPVTAHPVLAIGGILFGAWLAGSSRGRALVRRVSWRK